VDRQKALEAIDEARKAVGTLRQAIDEDKSLIADIASRTPLKDLKRLLKMLEAESRSGDE
jgi:hypothetical protein